MAKTQRKKMAKAKLRTSEEKAARLQKDLLGRNVRQQKHIIKLQRQLSAALKKSDERLLALALELEFRLGKGALSRAMPAGAGDFSEGVAAGRGDREPETAGARV